MLAFRDFEHLAYDLIPAVRTYIVVDPFFGPVVFVGLLLAEGVVEIVDFGSDPDYGRPLMMSPSRSLGRFGCRRKLLLQVCTNPGSAVMSSDFTELAGSNSTRKSTSLAAVSSPRATDPKTAMVRPLCRRTAARISARCRSMSVPSGVSERHEQRSYGGHNSMSRLIRAEAGVRERRGDAASTRWQTRPRRRAERYILIGIGFG
jgi:hypothetical protein